jgi:hypothetical protein
MTGMDLFPSVFSNYTTIEWQLGEFDKTSGYSPELLLFRHQS